MGSERVAVNWVGRYFSEADEAARALSNAAFSRMGDSHRHLRRSHWELDCFGVLLLFVDGPAEEPPPPLSIKLTRELSTVSQMPSTPVSPVRSFAFGPKEGEDPSNLTQWAQVK